uniref:Uncharacterized protein n=1 Tax=Nelumbo nucifera TaxID=4432 RepID=A0A822ZTW2_NELNU|nr:TPA_asm: hypothetical protein HUJ06_004546 [Nelumbo nucifera]
MSSNKIFSQLSVRVLSLRAFLFFPCNTLLVFWNLCFLSRFIFSCEGISFLVYPTFKHMAKVSNYS